MISQASSTEQTNYQFKLLYALGIVLIVAGHCNAGGIDLFFDWFPYGAFHVALFIFCSGYFYKSSNEAHFLEYLKKKATHLLLPLYVWTFVYALVALIMEQFGFTISHGISVYKLLIAPLLDGQQFQYNLAGWFIAPLFFTEILNCLLRKIIPIKEEWVKDTFFFALYLLIGILGVFVAQHGLRNGIWLPITRISYFLPFYGAGKWYHSFGEKIDKLPGLCYFSILFILELLIVYKCNEPPVSFPSESLFHINPIGTFLIGFLGIAFWVRVTRYMTPVLGNNKYVLAIADASFYIMINHLFGFFLIKFVFAAISSKTGLFGDFNWQRYYQDIFYCYAPGNHPQFYLLYLLAGLLFSIYLKKLVTAIRQHFKTR